MNNQCTFTISRKSSFVGVAFKLDVNIDNYQYKLGSGDSLSFQMLPGHHVITYSFWSRKTKTVEIDMVPGNYYTLIFKPDLFWGGFKVDSTSKLV